MSLMVRALLLMTILNYYAVNGRWPTDSKIVILVNNKIIRGTYRLNRENGRIILIVSN